jgi:hypothetical protein
MGRSVFFILGEVFFIGNWVLTVFFIFSSLMVTREGPGEFPALIYFPDRGYQRPSKPGKLADSKGESRRRPFFI